MIWTLRFLALCHFGWGGVLLLVSGWFAVSAFRILPYMSTGTLWTNLPNTMLAAALNALPPGALGVWMGILGRRLWSPGARLRAMLLWTHGVLLALGSLAVFAGIHAVKAADRSSAHGGGLLSPIAYVPLLFGVPVVVLALCSLAVAFVALPRYRPGGILPEDASPPSDVMSGKKALLLLSLLILLAGALVVGLRSLWR